MQILLLLIIGCSLCVNVYFIFRFANYFSIPIGYEHFRTFFHKGHKIEIFTEWGDYTFKSYIIKIDGHLLRGITELVRYENNDAFFLSEVENYLKNSNKTTTDC